MRITSFSNRMIREVRELMQKPRARQKAGLFVSEGERLCREIPKDLVERVFLSDSYRGSLPAGFRPKDHTLIRVPDELMAHISDTKHSQGILVLVRMLPERVLSGDFFLLLESLQDPGNLGTIFRLAEAAGVNGIYMSSDCTDIYSPKLVRSTMGSLYRLPFRIVPDLKETIAELKKKGVRCFAAHLLGEKAHYDCDFRPPTAFLIGNEGRGLSPELSEAADIRLRIPMKGGVESLNAAAAAAILSYETLRQREKQEN